MLTDMTEETRPTGRPKEFGEMLIVRVFEGWSERVDAVAHANGQTRPEWLREAIKMHLRNCENANEQQANEAGR